MASSTVVAFKAALITRLQARPGLADATVSWHVPVTQPRPDWILVDDVKSPDDQNAAALGGQRREEHYVLHILVMVRRPFRIEPKVVAQRAAALVKEIEDELRADCTVGGVVRVAEVAGVGLTEWAGADGDERGADMPVRINVRQRI